MGLCKCPKRKVTNLFCFEHRVNVCEYCIVANHAKCIVQSYLQWLQDSDYNPNCRLCNALLSNKETVRLVCYDLFHWSCLNEMANQLPQNTAPAGYQCPSCQGPVFPPTNLVSPVASALRDKLSTVNWARAGLRLPLIDETEVTQEMDTHNASECSDWSSFTALNSAEAAPQSSAFAYSASCNFESPQQQQQQTLKNGVADQHTIVSMSDGAPSSRKIYDTREAGVGQDSSTTIDFDEDKYRRRPTLSWLAQLLKNRFGTRKQPRSLMQRFVIFLLIGGIGFLTLVVVMMKLGRASADNDPSLDPKFNPHIRVGQ
ncbi:zinc finger protein-like 1 isoform X1 [Pseudonaja textilis]|uniref:zinc finger protein-like 1 isoform X1 n=1 Tax=Pseudonaja textilis TaxID=8673 RepID=UPI000EA8E6CC|nr:zinc finger protein-like 1 isoform X1 [Pseudonaja textilis]XP_026573441.1 zinc finger protein-like 1 isoform X1 [Pseudonaja textilis]XP_026573442.1 zinc finger protein-like 1 isoform X1 [Pseudonaja textilis]